MRIEHIAIWVSDLERMKRFYEKYFGAVANHKYKNPGKDFESYFLEFGNGARLETMKSLDVIHKGDTSTGCLGLAHFAVSVGSKESVDQVTSQLGIDGFSVVDGPRLTGDGYYESIVLDPEGNKIEITT